MRWKIIDKKRLILVFLALSVTCLCFFVVGNEKSVTAMPFYDLKPQNLVLRSEFYTTYSSSSEERKHNIKMASNSIDNMFVDVGGVFSFNQVVGERTQKRGYKQAKIIVGGEFVDGIGGGVCQVSTTLYNAVLLANLSVLEFHPHSLPVSYVAPSFDAMVNSGYADLKFINNTHNPIILKAIADGDRLLIKILGEPMQEKIIRKSVLTEEIPAPESEIVFDELGEYPNLYEGESMVVKYGKAGYKSEGYIEKIINGKIVGIKKIRSDKYSPVKGKIVYGRAVRQNEKEDCENIEQGNAEIIS